MGIFMGGLLGLICGLVIGTAVDATNSTLVSSTYFGVVSGLLICLIIEVNILTDTKKVITKRYFSNECVSKSIKKKNDLPQSGGVL